MLKYDKIIFISLISNIIQYINNNDLKSIITERIFSLHSLEKLRTNSHNEQSNEGVDIQKEEEENQIIVSKQCEGIKGVLKNKKKGQAEKLKVLRFSLPIKQIYIVENWKRYNQNFDEEKESCCQQF